LANRRRRLGPPWVGDYGFFISEPNHEGLACVLAPESASVKRVLRMRNPPFTFKAVHPSGIREYTDKSGRSAYEIQKGARSLILEEMEGNRLDIRFSDDLKKLAQHMDKILTIRSQRQL
jgi:hypothetical protein